MSGFTQREAWLAQTLASICAASESPGQDGACATFGICPFAERGEHIIPCECVHFGNWLDIAGRYTEIIHDS